MRASATRTAGRRHAALTVLLAGLLGLTGGTLVLVLPPTPVASASPVELGVSSVRAARQQGQGPLADVLYWADQKKACGLTRDQLAAMILVPTFIETGAGTLYAPSPMTLSRWDTQAGLYAFGDKATAYPKAFFHPGIGQWQFDSAGGWNLTAAGAINTYTAAQTAATMLAQRWCVNPSRSYAWAAWLYCPTSSLCENIYNEIYDGEKLVNVNQDLSVTSLGGMESRSCDVWSLGAVACSYVDPAKAQGYKSWSAAGAGPSPITAPFYVFAANGNEYRYWLAQDTGYPVTIMAWKPITANARTALSWAFKDDLCDRTAVRGSCDRSPFGRLDVASGGPGSVLVRGWGIDPDTNAAVDVHVYVDGRIAASVKADQPRPDLLVPFPSFGANHGFQSTLTGITGGSHTACAYGINVGPGGNALLGCAAFTVPSGSPFGAFDVASGGAGSISVRGWAIDPDTTSPIPVHVYVDGVGAGTGTAGQNRPDVAGAFPAYGADHGYELLVGGSLAPGNHQVCVYGINVGVGANATIGCRTVNIPSGSPFGAFDVGTPGFGKVTVKGWGIDPDTTSPIAVHVYVDGVGVGAGTANAQRPDVGAAFPLFGAAHGYEVAVGPFAGGPHNVCVYGINVGPGGNGTLGCRTVTGSGDPSGAFDSATAAFGVVRVTGWALDPDTAAAAKVRVTVDGSVLGTGSAGGARPDLAGVILGYGTNHGFDLTLSGVGGGTHDVCVTVLNTAGTGADVPLGCRSVTNPGEPFGNLDQASISGGTLTVRGWAIDPDTTLPTTVHLYVDGVGVGILATGQPRPDVASFWPYYGTDRGFTGSVSGLAPGQHWVCAYAINTGPGSANTTLGCVSA